MTFTTALPDANAVTFTGLDTEGTCERPDMTNPNTAERDTKTERRLQVAQLRKGGASIRQIAKALDVSPATVHGDLEVLREGWREEAQVATADHVALDLQRLDEWLMAIANAARSGEYRAIDTGLRIMERRAALLGLDAPKRIEQKVNGQLTVEDFITSTYERLIEEERENPNISQTSVLARLQDPHVTTPPVEGEQRAAPATEDAPTTPPETRSPQTPPALPPEPPRDPVEEVMARARQAFLRRERTRGDGPLHY